MIDNFFKIKLTNLTNTESIGKVFMPLGKLNLATWLLEKSNERKKKTELFLKKKSTSTSKEKNRCP